MSNTILEARAVISAEDRASAVIAALEKRVSGLGAATRALANAPSHINAVTRAVEKAAAAEQTSKRSAPSSVASKLSGLGSFMPAHLGAVIGGGMVAHEAIKASAARAHERVRMEVSGMSRKEIAEAEEEAAKISKEFPSLGQTETMHMLRNARSIVGSYKEAAEIAEPLAKLRVVAQGARPGADITEDFDQLVKGLEIKGVTQNPRQFREYMEGIAKGLNVFGDTLKPYQYYEMFKYGRQATPGLSSDFILSTAPTLAQELGGSSYGKAVAAFNSAIVSNVMKHSALKDFNRLGLIDNNDLLFTKTGEAKGLKPGRHIKGWETAQSNPNTWIREFLMPALQKAGVTDQAEILQRIGALFQNQTAAQLVGILATQQSRIDKDRGLLHGAPGLSAADVYMSKDPKIAWAGLKGAVESLAGSVGSMASEALTGPMNGAAKAIAEFTAELAKAKRKQEEGITEPSDGQKKANRLLNGVRGVDSDKAFGEDTQAEADAVGRRAAGRVLAMQKELARAERERADLGGKADKPRGFFSTDFSEQPSAGRSRLDARIAYMKGELAKSQALVTMGEELQQAREAYARLTRDMPREMSKHGQVGSVLPESGMAPSAFPLALPGGKDRAPGQGYYSPGWTGDGLPRTSSTALPPEAPADRVQRALNPQTIQAEVSGTVSGEARLSVGVTSEFISIVNEAKAIKLQGNLRGHDTGRSSPDAAPGAQTGHSE